MAISYREGTGECLQTLQGHTNRVWSVTFSPDGQTLVSGGDDYTVKLWNVRQGKCFKTLLGHGSQVLSITTDGGTLFSSSADNSVKF